MSRYIDVDALGIGRANPDVFIREEYASGWNLAIEIIENAPTADVVEVVRCKDCFFYQKDKELAKANYLDPEKYCALLICEIDKNGFCGYGKKNGR